jgi:hypothetical protein
LPLFILFLSPSSYSRNPVTGGARLISWLGLLLLFFCYLVYFNKLTWNIIILSLNWSSMKHPQLSCLHFPWFLSWVTISLPTKSSLVPYDNNECNGRKEM